MRLPDGSTLMHDAVHAYDPVKAHEYYLKVRKLKGRKKAGPEIPKPAATKKPVDAAKKKVAWEKFLNGLPMAVEGADVATTNAFVQSMRGKTDAQLKSAAAKIKKERGDNDGAQVATINALIANRNRVRSAKVLAKPTPTSATPKAPAKPKLSPKERAEQRANAKKRISSLKNQLSELNDKLKERIAEAKDAEAKAKRGPTAADKADAARDAKKYRDKNAQKIANKAKEASSDSKSSPKTKKDTVESLRTQISEVKGRLTAANEKLQSLS